MESELDLRRGFLETETPSRQPVISPFGVSRVVPIGERGSHQMVNKITAIVVLAMFCLELTCVHKIATTNGISKQEVCMKMLQPTIVAVATFFAVGHVVIAFDL